MDPIVWLTQTAVSLRIGNSGYLVVAVAFVYMNISHTSETPQS